MMWRDLKYFVLGEPITSRLPEPVWTAIAQRQQQGEILIAWSQIIIGALWALLYLLAPKTFEDDTSFAPVPIALTVYFLFACARLYLLRAGWRSNALPILSILVDMAVLLLLIWSFHLQYGQPAAFYLKAPTILYDKYQGFEDTSNASAAGAGHFEDGGYAIDEVSAGNRLGLRAGDKIVAINGEPVGQANLGEALLGGGEGLEVVVERDGSRETLTFAGD